MNDDRDVDSSLRALLEPEKNAVDRLVDAALKPELRLAQRRPRRTRFALAAAGMLAGAAALLWFNARSPETQDWLIISPIGDIMLLQSSSGEDWIIGPERPDDRLPAGMGFVIVEGEMK
jgi:hypothetical protein